ncbi:PAS/PAC sensor hybrid histidine kinase [Planoprotostelium fungivorum]|uniref:PAS/PAC sensor hybrid histidine kinase n=1 Tax=Planoprotostelium fungivorum TaxID=1890364 RepID=A0A2P6P064_9EUKA|nr:PAS/PAC sensor hybrid histidine kinase [Planoprotostelium fungivorum]
MNGERKRQRTEGGIDRESPPLNEGAGKCTPSVSKFPSNGGVLTESDLSLLSSDMRPLMHNVNYRETEMGDMSIWPAVVKSCIETAMYTKIPVLVMAGPELRMFYNAAYSQLVGQKHPAAFGDKVSHVWPEIWDHIGPLLKSVYYDGKVIQFENLFLPISKGPGGLTEHFWSFCYSPVVDGTTVVAVQCIAIETTEGVVGSRQLRLSKDISQAATCATVDEAYEKCIATIGGDSLDFPMAILYRSKEDDGSIVYNSYQSKDSGKIPPFNIESIRVDEKISCSDPTESEFRTAFGHAVFDGKFKMITIPSTSSWSIKCSRGFPVTSLYVTPIGRDSVLVLAINPLHHPDNILRQFLSHICSQIESNVTCARDREEQQRKAKELADLDRAKNIFFSNLSHEFRTPLTLLCSPLGELKRILAGNDQVTEALDIMDRNTIRLYKLVNTLLDFAKAEGGRLTPQYEDVDVSSVTNDIIYDFGAVCHTVGLEFSANLAKISSLVAIDVSIYEKIVLNLLSNAYKYTTHGSITVDITEISPEEFQLSVTDTGCGVSAVHLPHLFERFYRVQDASGRSHEGSGIGLSIVDQYSSLLGGTVSVESEEGRGTTFRARQSWQQMEEKLVDDEYSSNDQRPLVLVVDDNNDMRRYLKQILDRDYRIQTATNGAEAKTAAQSNPDIILCDIMMPQVDGFEFVRWLRGQREPLKNTSVIVITARTSETVRIEGLDCGADDALVKPFQAEELRARVRSHIHLSQARRQAVLREIEQSKKDLFLASLSHEMRTPLAPVLLITEELRADESLTKHTRQQIELIQKNVQMEVQLIDDLLDITKITKGKLVFKPITVDVYPIIDHTLDLLKQEIADKETQVPVVKKALNHCASADPTRMQQILWNIIRNAIKFTPKGGKVSVSVTNPTPHTLRFEVTDTGIGMNKEVIDGIFNPFEQGGEGINQQFGGLGLGLSISKSLATMHHGSLTAVSRGLGEGSTFIFELPAVEGNLHTDIIPSKNNPWKIASEKLEIMLVEDNKPTIMVMDRILTRLGYSVKTATDYASAVKLSEEFRFDLLISDIGLPDRDGVDLITTLRKNIKRPFFAIATTGYGREEDVERCTAAGFNMHLTKPVSVEKLKEAINMRRM